MSGEQGAENKTSQKKGNKNNNNRRNNNNNQNQNANRGNRRNPPNRQKRAENLQNHRVDMRKYDKMLSAAHDNFSDIPCGEQTEDCVICCKPNDVFGIGTCRHLVCIECAIRLRVLGETTTCSVCRANIDVLNFVTLDFDFETVSLPFPPTNHPDESRYGIRFSNEVAGKKYEKYLAHVCKICKTDDEDRLEFPNFISLRQHMANAHQLSYCMICTDNLNLFSRERKTYTRDSLQRHIRIGDSDDKSFKGHPQCLFCELKFLDAETRYKHLRKEHFFCQFCEADGTMTNVFFGKHDELIAHYEEVHFICEFEECKKMGIAFPSKFELDLHKVSEHGGKRKAIDIGFTNAREQGSSSGNRRNQPPQRPAPAAPQAATSRIAIVPRNRASENPQSDQSQFTITPSAQSRNTSGYHNLRPAYTPQVEDFPTLSSAPPQAPNVRSTEFPRLGKVNKTTPKPAKTGEEFPPLAPNASSSSSSSSSSTIRIPVAPIQKVVKRQPLQQAKSVAPPKPRSNRDEDDEDDFIRSRGSVPQAVIKVNNSMMRFDMVDSSNRPAQAPKSNVQLVSKIRPSSSSSVSSSKPLPSNSDFPTLPAASAPMAPGNPAWIKAKQSKATKGIITGVVVPKNHEVKNNKKNKNPVPLPQMDWPDLSKRPEPKYEPKEEEWKEVPLSKKAQMEKEKKERKEQWAKRKAEMRAAIAASGKAKATDPEERSEPVSPVENVVEESDVAQDKQQDDEWREVKTKNGSPTPAAKKKNKKKKNNETKSNNDHEHVENLLKTAEGSVDNNNVQKSNEINKEIDDIQQKIDSLWNMPPLPSVSSLLSNFSLGGLFGGVSSNSDAAPSVPPPPPGLEDVVATPPPGLKKSPTDNGISFDSAPVFSHEDMKQKRELLEQQKQKDSNDEGWITTGKPKNQKKKKRNN